MLQIPPEDDRLLYLKSAIDLSTEAMFVTEKCRESDAGHRILFVNTPFSRQTGYRSADSVKRCPSFLFGPTPDAHVISRVAAAFLRRRPTRIELLSYRKDGSDFHAELTVNPLVVADSCDHALVIQRAKLPARTTDGPQDQFAELFKRMADSLDEAILIHRNREPLFANAAYLDLLGYATLSEALLENGPLFDVIAETRLCLRDARTDAATPLDRPSTFNYQAIRPDGRAIHLTARCRPIDWPGGPATLMSIAPAKTKPPRRVARQVGRAAAPTLADRATQCDQSLIGRLVDTVPMMVAYKDRNLVFQFANQLFADWVGRPREEIVGHHVSEIRDEGHYQMMKPRRAEVFAGKTLRYDTTRDVPGLGLRNLAVLLVPHRNQAEEVVGYFTLVNDVTELKDIEKALAQRESQLNLIINSVPVLITYRDRNLRYRYVNKTFEEWYGLPPDRVIGRRMTDVLDVVSFAKIKPYVDRVLAGEDVQYEGGVRYPQVGDCRVLANFVPHKDDTGNVVGFFTISQIMAEAGDQPDGVGESIGGRTQVVSPG